MNTVCQLSVCKDLVIYTYWINGTVIPSGVVTKVRKIAYRFSWDGRKFIPLSRMITPKLQGGLENFIGAEKISHLSWLHRIWVKDDFILSS